MNTLPDTMNKWLKGTASLCLGLLILQTSTSFLPDIVVLKYLTTTRLILSAGLVCLALLSLLERSGESGRESGGERYALAERLSLPLTVAVAVFLVWSACSSAFSLSPISFSGFRLTAEEILACLLVIGLIKDEEGLKNALIVLLMALSVAALLSVKQVVEYENTNFFLVYRNGWRAIEALEIPKGAIVRASGHFENPNLLAAYLIMLLPLGVAAIKRLTSSPWMAGAIVLTSATALALTFCRGAIIGLLIAVGIVFARRRRKYALAVIPAVALVVANPLAIGRMASGFERLGAWSSALGMIAKRPFFGVGLGNFRAFALAETGRDFWHAHNIFLHTTAETGIVGGLAFLALIFFAIRTALRLSDSRGYGGHIGTALAVSFIAFGIASLVDDAYNSMPISYIFWLLLGLLVAAGQIFDGRGEEPDISSASL